MRSIHATSGIPEDDALDAEHSSCGATPLQTGWVPSRARRTASQLRKGAYGRDLGTRPADNNVGVPTLRGASCEAWRTYSDTAGLCVSHPGRTHSLRRLTRIKNGIVHSASRRRKNECCAN